MNYRRIFSLAVFTVLMALSFGSMTIFADDDFSYTDRQLMVATQIAYYDFDQEQLDRHGGAATVRELLNESQVYQKLENGWYSAESDLEKRIAQRNLELYEEISETSSAYGGWKVVAIKNENEEHGFYGVLIETDPEHAIVAFRGSESTDENQIIKDWINADFGLLMDEDTMQQKIAAQFMEEINQKFSYIRYAVTGHSLGGNLAEHAAIAAPDEMRGKLVQACNFDGPGYSKEYLNRNQALIGKVIYPVVHYRWSLVGALLTQPACSQTRIVKVTDEINKAATADANYMRHATTFIAFDGDQVQDGEEDLASLAMGAWSRQADERVIELRREQEAKGPAMNPA